MRKKALTEKDAEEAQATMTAILQAKRTLREAREMV